VSREFCLTTGAYFHTACSYAVDEHKRSDREVTQEFGNVLYFIAALARHVASIEADGSSVKSEANTMLRVIAAARDQLEFLRVAILEEMAQ
jgi:hypothetical protein